MAEHLIVIDDQTMERANTSKPAIAAALVAAHHGEATVTDGVIAARFNKIDDLWIVDLVTDQLFPTDPRHWLTQMADILNMLA